MNVVHMSPKFSARDMVSLGKIRDVVKRVGNNVTMEIDEALDMTMASFVLKNGNSVLCLVKLHSGVQAFRNEEQNPYWTGRNLADYINYGSVSLQAVVGVELEQEG